MSTRKSPESAAGAIKAVAATRQRKSKKRASEPRKATDGDSELMALEWKFNAFAKLRDATLAESDDPDPIDELMDPICQEIMRLPAHTLAGLKLKAKGARYFLAHKVNQAAFDDLDFDMKWIVSLIRDVEAMPDAPTA
ncbi:MAG: hypothetical protein M9932_01740 [Xanthobacteraceae bacterium]|nr:hypothetical protein [Xanthobacteraceae bacterium]